MADPNAPQPRKPASSPAAKPVYGATQSDAGVKPPIAKAPPKDAAHRYGATTADAGAVLLNPTRVPLGLPAPDPAVRPEADDQPLVGAEQALQAALAAQRFGRMAETARECLELEEPWDGIAQFIRLSANILADDRGLCDVTGQRPDLMAGADVRYDMGEDHPAGPTGWFVPPLVVTTGDGRTQRVAELLHDGRPVLLDLTGGNDLADTAESSGDRVRRVVASAADAPAPALLIRPDGYVAWAGADPAGLTGALARWFGPEAGARAD